MICPKCGSVLVNGADFCSNCGSKISAPAPVAAPIPQQNAYNTVPVTPVYPTVNLNQQSSAPLSPWAYWGYKILFGIPLIGFICLIIFSVDSSNINRRNFARSYWISYLFITIIFILIFVVTLILGVSMGGLLEDILEEVEYMI